MDGLEPENSLPRECASYDSPTMNSTLKLSSWAVLCLAFYSHLIAQAATNVSSPSLQPPLIPLR
jgi:hypothetical protein